MKMTKVLIVGDQGTTGLRLKDRLSRRGDLTLLEIDESLRKDKAEIHRLMHQADFVFLCLPDGAAREISEMADDTGVRIIDTSTAHRISDGWVYGFPELSSVHRRAISLSSRVASPGCHAGGFIALIYPLVSAGLLSPDCALTCTSITGYSGGGKKMIQEYENPDFERRLTGPKLYAMGQEHKHLPEMMKQCSLNCAPVFLPIVGPYYSGMLTAVPIDASMLKKDLAADGLRQIYKNHYYHSGLVKVKDGAPSDLHANMLSGRDDMEIYVTGTDGRYLLCVLFDNLGKGASGAAIQCFNIMCGLPEETGLEIG